MGLKDFVDRENLNKKYSKMSSSHNSNNNTRAFAHQNLIVFAIMLVMFLAAMDNMITSTILPAVLSDLGGLELYPWITTAFMLSTIIVTPIYGKLSDIYGHKLFILIAIFLFLAASALCGTARSMEQFIFFRALQGLGAGGLMTMSFVMFGILFPPEKRGRMQGLLSSVWGLASIVGPILGSVFTSQLSWHWAFYVNIPFGLWAAYIIITKLQKKEVLEESRRIDFGGVLIFAAGALALLYSLSVINQSENRILHWGIVASAILVLLIFLYYEKRHPEAIFPVEIFKHKVVLIPALISLIAGLIMFSTINFVPILVQGVMGLKARHIGFVIVALAIGWSGGSIISGRLLNHFGFLKLIVAGGTAMTLGLVGLYFFKTGFGIVYLMLPMFFLGSGMGFVSTCTLIAVQSAVPLHSLGVSTSGIQLMRSFGGTIGLALLGGIQISIFKADMKNNLKPPVSPDLAELIQKPHLILDHIARANISETALNEVSQFLFHSIHIVFLVALFISIFNWALGLLTSNKKPAELAKAASVNPE